jgi:hypothetical protein
MKICLYKNFDDFDDYMEDDIAPEDIGEYLYNKEKEGWQLGIEDYSTIEALYILALKADWQYEQIINTLKKLYEEIHPNV